MKIAVTLFFLMLMLSTQTPMGQLLKLPLLVEHFLKHQQRDDVGLRVFLAEHYATDHRDADLPEDEQLPFKNASFYGIGCALVTPYIHTTLFTPLPAEKKILLPGSGTPQQHLSSIFHPPRVELQL